MRCRWCNGWEGVKPVMVNGRTVLHLCFRCAGVYFESGEKPPNYRITNDQTAGWQRLGRFLDRSRG